MSMNRQFILVTNGLLPVAMLVLLAIAVIAGQARANLSVRPETVRSAASAEFDTDHLKSADSLPHVVSIIMALPAELELTVKAIRGAAETAQDATAPVSPE
jgi:hypothetical protein